jgi:hypothetical protein
MILFNGFHIGLFYKNGRRKYRGKQPRLSYKTFCPLLNNEFFRNSMQ